MMMKQLSCGSVCRAQVFAWFSGHGNTIYNIIPLLKKENVHQLSKKFFFFTIKPAFVYVYA